MADLSGLLNEITVDNPCGENLEYDSARTDLDTKILGTPENQFSGEKAIPPNWKEVQKDALALLQKSRDLQVILYLIRSLINLEGWSGFRDGLGFLLESLQRYWDCIHPQLDPDDGLDPTMRINIIEELVSFDLVLKPLTLMMLVESKAVGRFCLRDIQYATDKLDVPDGTTKPEVSSIKAVFLDLDSDTLSATQQTIIDCIGFVDQIDSFLIEKVGASESAALSTLKSLLKEARYEFEGFAGSKLEGSAELDADSDENDTDDDSNVGKSTKPKAATGDITSRQDVLRMLDLLCKYYAENEPSSPVPILLQRAKYLVTADFMEIVQNLVPDGLSQIAAIKGPDLN